MELAWKRDRSGSEIDLRISLRGNLGTGSGTDPEDSSEGSQERKRGAWDTVPGAGLKVGLERGSE